MPALTLLFALLGGVLLLSSLLTVFFFPLNSPLLWGKVVVGLLLLGIGLGLNFKQLRRSLSQGRALFLLSTVVSALALAIVLAASYALIDRQNIEIDLTRDHVYTLSAQTKQVLKEIDAEVLISAFYVKQAPQREILSHMMQRYQALNPKMKLRLIDPDMHPELLQKYKIGKDSPHVIVERGQRQTRFDELNEQGLTNALIRVSDQQARRIYFLTGHGETDIQEQKAEGLSASVKEIESQGDEVVSLSLAQTRRVPDDAGMVIVVGPQIPLFAPEQKALGACLGRCGRLRRLLEANSNAGLAELLRRWHLSQDQDTVIDDSAYGRMFGLGPDSAVIFKYNDQAIVNPLKDQMTVLSGACSLERIDEGEGVDPHITLMPLFSSSPRSWGEKHLSQGHWTRDEDEPQGPLLLAAAAQKNTSGVDEKLRISNRARLVVVGDSSFANNRYRNLQRNRDLFLNMIAWLSERDDRMQIQPRLRGASRIVLSAKQEAFIAFFALDLLPVGLIALGLSIWLLRRRH